MSDMGEPPFAADRIEWMILGEARQEVSRGDIQTERSFDVEPTAGDWVLRQERLDREIDDCFDHLQYRAAVFSDTYAFSVEDDVVRRLENTTNESDAHFVYRFLLACNQTKYSQRLGAAFTELCKIALSRFLGSNAQVWNTDAGSADRRPMGGSTKRVAKFLESALGAVLDTSKLEDLPASGGDGGCDLVACITFDDGAPGHLTILGQCAASSSSDYWRDKIHQPHRFQSLYSWTSVPVLALFIPSVYRKSSGKWFNQINVGQTLVFDRVRIMKCLNIGQVPLPPDVRQKLERALNAALTSRGKAARAVRKKAAKKVVTKTASRSGSQKAPVRAVRRTVASRKSPVRPVAKKGRARR